MHLVFDRLRDPQCTRLLLKEYSRKEANRIICTLIIENHFCPIYGASVSFTHKDAVELQLSNEDQRREAQTKRTVKYPSTAKPKTTYVN